MVEEVVQGVVRCGPSGRGSPLGGRLSHLAPSTSPDRGDQGGVLEEARLRLAGQCD